MMHRNDPLERTDILKAEFGKSWRVWAWVRRQFSPISIATIAGLVGVAGGWVINLKTRVVVLETRVLPVIMDESAVKVLQGEVENHEGRINTLELNYRAAAEASRLPPTPRHK